jgi:HEAT repeat protein
MQTRFSQYIVVPLLAVSLAGALSGQPAAEKVKDKEKTKAKYEELREYQQKWRDPYLRGKLALDKRDWDGASEFFNLAAQSGERADGAMYWEAYALARQAEMVDAQAVLENLGTDFPNSRWGDDAKALTYFIQQSAGSPPDPDMEDDEELKLYAINSLAKSNPERAVPLLKKIINEPNHPKLKERALFVLAMTNSPDSIPTVESLARGSGNPDLQLKAIHYLGLLKNDTAGAVLAEVYPNGDAAVKRSVLRAYTNLGEADRLVDAANEESDPEIAGEAIRGLGILKQSESLVAVYGQTESKQVRSKVIHALALTGEPSALINLATSESDPDLRNEAIKRLGMSRHEDATRTLIELYPSGDASVRREVLRALFIQQNASALVSMARQEQDPELKKYAVKHLSHMKAPEAQEFMLELLGQ